MAGKGTSLVFRHFLIVMYDHAGVASTQSDKKMKYLKKIPNQVFPHILHHKVPLHKVTVTLVKCCLVFTSLYEARAERWARKIMKDPSHPGHGLFEKLPSRKRLWLLRTDKVRHQSSFFPSVVRLINNSKVPLDVPSPLPVPT